MAFIERIISASLISALLSVTPTYANYDHNPAGPAICPMNTPYSGPFKIQAILGSPDKPEFKSVKLTRVGTKAKSLRAVTRDNSNWPLLFNYGYKDRRLYEHNMPGYGSLMVGPGKGINFSTEVIDDGQITQTLGLLCNAFLTHPLYGDKQDVWVIDDDGFIYLASEENRNDTVRLFIVTAQVYPPQFL